MVESSAVAFWFALLPLAGAPRPFDGTYTIVNKANGRRMFASTQAGLFTVDDSGPIYHDQMWYFAPQENQSFAIVNAANGMRVLAQSTADGENGFFAVDHGPIFQDQRWRFSSQADGSYIIMNVKSGRRILAQVGSQGKLRFAAIADAAPAQSDEMWWIINQERDETARFVAELEIEKGRVAVLAEEIAAAKNSSGQLLGQLRKALEVQRTVALEAEARKRDSLTTLSELEDERVSKAMLERDIQAHQSELVRLESELLAEKRGREQLLGEIRIKQGEHMQQKLDLEGARSAQRKLSEDLRARSSETRRLASELRAVKDTKVKLIDTVSVMRSDVATLSSQMNSASQANLELASKMTIFEALPQSCLAMANIHADASVEFLGALLVIAVVATIASCGRRHFGLLTDIRGKQKRITMLEQELHAEFGDMVQVGDFHGGLGSDFGFRVFNAEINQEAVRLIKVQCPGVKHADVEIDLVFNGCEVTIHRQASRGVMSATWKKRFQFKPSDGLYEFREEQMVLEDGFLQLVFRACAFQSRMVLFPRHFSLTDTDADACWDYAADGDVEQSDEAEAWWNEPSGPHTRASVCPATPGKQASLVDADTESTASTARVLV